MIISNSALDQLVTYELVKPLVKLGKYHLKWSSSSPGIPENEEIELKSFFGNVVPYLTKMTDASRQMQDYFQREQNLGADDLNLDLFCPFVLLSHGLEVTYDVSTTWDGVYFVDRTEEIHSKGDGSDPRASNIRVRWEIGEIVEDLGSPYDFSLGEKRQLWKDPITP